MLEQSGRLVLLLLLLFLLRPSRGCTGARCLTARSLHVLGCLQRSGGCMGGPLCPHPCCEELAAHPAMPTSPQVAKLRAARRLWAKLVKEKFGPADEKSLVLRTHCQVAALCAPCQPTHAFHRQDASVS